MNKVGAQIAIMLGILLILHVLLEGVVRDDDVGVEQLGNGVVNGLVPILAGSIFYVTVTFSFLVVYDTTKRGIPPPKIEGLE